MPNASTTQTSSASQTTGQPISLTYGYAWVTGKRHAYYELQNTHNSWMDYTRVGIWLLGHGEWDGPIELWINDVLALRGMGLPAPHTPGNYFSGQNWVMGLDNNPQFPELVFNFHRGADTPLGTPLFPFNSSGPDQGMDVLWAQFPPAIQPLAFSRIAYYAIMRKQAIAHQTSDHRDDPAQWGDIAPIGLWRALRCRLFDDEGNQSGYAFTTNPAWHYIDAILRRRVFPDYGLDLNTGPDQLSDAIRNRFNWGELYSAAQYFDGFLANGRRRFEGNYSFSSQTSLQAVLEQILLCCRSYSTEYAGKIGLRCDMPRSSVFTFSRSHILPGSWYANDQVLNKSANRYIAKFRDVLVPALQSGGQLNQIMEINCSFGGNPVVSMEFPHPFVAGDFIEIGGTGTTYDGEWQVNTVPDVLYSGTPDEIDPVSFTVRTKGSNFPASVGQGGCCGLLYSRFKERSPEFWHKSNMLARGAVGMGIPRQREKVKQEHDFATTTWDQAARLSCYERDRLLGVDQTPYITPPALKFRTSMFARDVAGNLACAVRPGDHVTIDDTASFTYAGEYEVLDGLTDYMPTVEASGSEGKISLRPSENSGEIEFPLGPYNEAIMYDASDPTQAGWPSVPGSDPGNSSKFVSIPLASGQFSFFTGSDVSGIAFQLPSTGYPPANTLSWAGPAGYGGANNSGNPSWNGHMATIQICAVLAGFLLKLNYEDNDGSLWQGFVNYACLAWLSGDVPTVDSGGITWIELTLAGGEKIVFGQGVLTPQSTFTLPAGYSTSRMFAVAYPHDGSPVGGHNAHWVGAFVDGSQVIHVNFKDGEGNMWHGNGAVLIFAWKNNIGTWTTQTLGGATWAQCPLTGSLIFGVGCAKGVADGSTLTLPAAAGDGSTLQAIVGTSGWDYTDNGHEAHGIYASYLDAARVVHIQFGDGSSNIWSGAADVFALYCMPGVTISVVVAVSPATASLAAGSIQQFSAVVAGTSNQGVTWSVDGLVGGSVLTGTIDANGFFCAPNVAGVHAITAASSASPSSSATAPVTVFGSTGLPLNQSVLTDGQGNIVYVNSDVIYVVEG